jgi:hypothetical protein
MVQEASPIDNRCIYQEYRTGDHTPRGRQLRRRPFQGRTMSATPHCTQRSFLQPTMSLIHL